MCVKHVAMASQLTVTKVVRWQRICGWAHPGVASESESGGGRREEEAGPAPVWGTDWEGRRFFPHLVSSVLHPRSHTSGVPRGDKSPRATPLEQLYRTLSQGLRR